MGWRQLATTAALASVLWMARQPTVAADRYDDTAEQADRLWAAGKKLEAVQLYGSIWQLKPEDVERQIVYGERSAEVGNYRWALNFFRVAETRAKDDPARLYRIYLGYAKTYRMSGRPDRARPYEEKAAALRGPEGARDTPPAPAPERYYFGYYTESPPTETPVAVSPTTAETRDRKKHIAVAPIGSAVRRAGMDIYTDQIRTMLIAELRSTNRFSVVEYGESDGLRAELNRVAPNGAAKGQDTRRLPNAQLVVNAEISEFESRSATDRVGAGPASARPGQSSIRVSMVIRISDAASGVPIASESVAASRATSARSLIVDLAGFRWDDPKAQVSMLGIVTRELIQKALERILARAEKIPWHASVTRGTDDEVYFNAGSQDGVRLGDRFTILSGGGGSATSPTGGDQGKQGKEVGEIEVIRVDQTSAVGRVLKKEGPFNPLDQVVPR